MTLYEYKCLDCDQRFQKFSKVADRDLAPACVDCGSNDTKRVIGGGVSVWKPTKFT